MNSKKTDISIIIINYNLAAEIGNCLKSLLAKIDKKDGLNYEIIIVDNNSPDKQLPEIERQFQNDKISFYYLEENIGFGKGCNYGFSKASGKYICFLNPDTLIQENLFSPIIGLFEKDESIGIIGPKQQVRGSLFDFSAGFYPNILFELFNLFGLGVFFEGFIVNLMSKLSKRKILRVNWILGAAIFIKADLFRSINGFDKDYFMFFEEMDLCKRVSNLGLKILYLPRYSIHHIGSVSGKKDYRKYTIRTYSSKFIYISKHYKSLNKYLMKILLFAQLFSQIIIWSMFYPLNSRKSREKLSAFTYLIKNKMQLGEME